MVGLLFCLRSVFTSRHECQETLCLSVWIAARRQQKERKKVSNKEKRQNKERKERQKESDKETRKILMDNSLSSMLSQYCSHTLWLSSWRVQGRRMQHIFLSNCVFQGVWRWLIQVSGRVVAFVKDMRTNKQENVKFEAHFMSHFQIITTQTNKLTMRTQREKQVWQAMNSSKNL